MSATLGALCDDFYASARLFLKMDMPYDRETILHFFDRIRKEYPGLHRLRRREEGGLVLEEDAPEGLSRRWIRLEQNSLRFGHFAPPVLDDFRRFGLLILTQAPFHLTFSDIDFDHLEVVLGFDLEYRGNHDQLVAETLLGEHAGCGLFASGRARNVIDAQPYFGISLSPECDLQAYVEVKSRTTTYEVRHDSFESAPISVFLTTRKFWSVESPGTLEEGFKTLSDIAEELAAEIVVPNMVNPLAAAIASRS